MARKKKNEQLDALVDQIQSYNTLVPLSDENKAFARMLHITKDYTDEQWQSTRLHDVIAQVYFNVNSNDLKRALDEIADSKHEAKVRTIKMYMEVHDDMPMWTGHGRSRTGMEYYYDEEDRLEEFMDQYQTASAKLIELFSAHHFNKSLNSAASQSCQKVALRDLENNIHQSLHHSHHINPVLDIWANAVMNKSDQEIIEFATKIDKAINSYPVVQFFDYNDQKSPSLKQNEYYFKPWEHVLKRGLQTNSVSLINHVPKITDEKSTRDLFKNIMDNSRTGVLLKSDTVEAVLKKFKATDLSARLFINCLNECTAPNEISFVDAFVLKFKKHLIDPCASETLAPRLFNNIITADRHLLLNAFMKHPLMQESMLSFVKDRSDSISDFSSSVADVFCSNTPVHERYNIYSNLLENGWFAAANQWIRHINEPQLEEKTYEHMVKHFQQSAPELAALLNKKLLTDALGATKDSAPVKKKM